MSSGLHVPGSVSPVTKSGCHAGSMKCDEIYSSNQGGWPSGCRCDPSRIFCSS